MALTTCARAAFALGAILALVSLASGADARETSPEIRLSEGAARRLLAAHQYRMRDKVPLYANKAGPFHNPSEVRRALVSRALSGGARPVRFRRRENVASARRHLRTISRSSLAHRPPSPRIADVPILRLALLRA